MNFYRIDGETADTYPTDVRMGRPGTLTDKLRRTESPPGVNDQILLSQKSSG